MAFCAGTGVLVYLDLIGHLILRNSLPFIRHNSLENKASNMSFRAPSDFSAYKNPMSAVRFVLDDVQSKGYAPGSGSTSEDFPEKAYSVLSDHF
mmetsp:Transcript_40200/g.52685  ORF Transcript_40200/g.52685 Transcript_40200/m.52685 type:complete len:94 (+) Transcript_40200:802-1083(+)